MGSMKEVHQEYCDKIAETLEEELMERGIVEDVDYIALYEISVKILEVIGELDMEYPGVR